MSTHLTQAGSAVAAAVGRSLPSPSPRDARPEAASTASPAATPTSRLKATVTRGGIRYALLYAVRHVTHGLLDWLDRRLVRSERRKCLVEPWTISARRFTAAENKLLWNGYDWSKHGEEWTKSAAWKDQLVRDWLIPYFPSGGTFLEIGPGGGRWTEVLQPRAESLYVVDVAEMPIALCRQRFAHCRNIEYFLGDGRSIQLPRESVDGIWSYDVFVHITPLDVRNYFFEFSRTLRPGGHAVIHHAGAPLPGHRQRPGWRSDLTDEMVHRFAREAGLQLVAQTDQLVNRGDLLTVLRRPEGISTNRSGPTPNGVS
jgi:ubiquinone/menaquinone biosynthesis C-methylase UbiE